MAEMIVEYKDKSGYCIVRISEKKYYYGDGKEINTFGISANQFLRFNPYMEYVGDKGIKPNDAVAKWINDNRDGDK